MTSFPSALRSVLSGRIGPEVSDPPILQRSWALFKRALPAPAVLPGADLNRVIESEVIPRLVAAYGFAPRDKTIEDDGLDRLITPTRLARQILLEAPETQVALCQRLLNVGLTPEAIYRDLLAPTASLFGDLWDRDEISFVDATIGLGRLRLVLRELGWNTPYNGDDQITPRVALFAPAPGEELTFGFYLVEETFRWSGWRTLSETAPSTDELEDIVRRRPFDLLCLSLNRPDCVEKASLTIDAIRRSSRNPDIIVLIEGRASDDRPDLAAALGAHAATSGGRPALQIADKAVWPPLEQ
jgi:methanogenic corrinoid protein MtbC1